MVPHLCWSPRYGQRCCWAWSLLCCSASEDGLLTIDSSSTLPATAHSNPVLISSTYCSFVLDAPALPFPCCPAHIQTHTQTNTIHTHTLHSNTTRCSFVRSDDEADVICKREPTNIEIYYKIQLCLYTYIYTHNIHIHTNYVRTLNLILCKKIWKLDL